MSETAIAAAEPDLIPPGVWTIDEQRSSVGFRVRHFGFSTVKGRFTHFAGAVGPGGAAGHVFVDSIDTGQPVRDARLRTELFDEERFPQIAFVAPGGLAPRLEGSLTIRDVSRPVVFDVSAWSVDGEVVVRATASISRRAFGLDWAALREAGRLVVSDRVDLVLDIVAVRA